MENMLDEAQLTRVELSREAADLLRRLTVKHGPLMFHQSGGCCDGSSPMCYPAGEFITGDAVATTLSAALTSVARSAVHSPRNFKVMWSRSGVTHRTAGSCARP